MIDHARVLERYRHSRDIRHRLSDLLANSIPRKTLEECGRILGFFRNGTLVFETEDELPLLLDYCIYYPQSEGGNLVTRFLETTPPPADSEEMDALQAMTHAYYSLFQVTEVVRGVGIGVRDLLRNETGFIADIGFGNSAQPHLMVATRIIPIEDFFMTGGAGLPVDASAARRIVSALNRTGFNPATFDFRRITPRQEAEVAALIIRECRSTGMTSHIVYAEPGAPPQLASGGSRVRRVGRNEPCPCGSGKKFKMCCGRTRA